MADETPADLRQDYDRDTAYFELLSMWQNSGRFARRVKPLVRCLRSCLSSGSVCLDAGCAAGAMAIELAKAGVKRVDAVDFSSTALRFAEENARRHRVADRIRFFQGNVERLEAVPEKTYDVVVAADVIEHLTRPQAFVAEMWRVCRPGGHLLVETPNTLFRQHPWYSRIAACCQRLGMPDSRYVFPVDLKQDWGHYHVSLMSWPELGNMFKSAGWQVVREIGFGWWLRFGAADNVMNVLCRSGSLVKPALRYYASTDVVIIARKPESVESSEPV